MAPVLLALISMLPTIWIVDASNGPGTNFTDLPAAVAAAVSGDTILVRAGNYTCFSVSGKALTIRGAGASTTTVASVPLLPPFEPRIDSVPAGMTFYIDGMTFQPWPSTGTGASVPPIQAGLYVLGATTRVVLADVAAIGATLPGAPPTSDGTAGLSLAGGAEVHASRCTFIGGSGTGSGGAGAYVGVGCRLAAEASTFSGGSTATYFDFSYGGAGLHVANGIAAASRSSFFGGVGGGGGGDGIRGSGTGGHVRLAFTPADMIGGGWGGGDMGYALFVFQGASAQVHGVPTVVLPSAGAPVVSGTVTTSQPLPHLSISGAAAGGGELLATQPVTVTFNGLIPFASFTCIVDFGPAFSTANAPMYLGEVLVPFPPAAILQGTLDAFGMMQMTFTPALATPVLLNVPVYAQFGVLDSTIGQVRLSNGPVWFFRN